MIAIDETKLYVKKVSIYV